MITQTYKDPEGKYVVSTTEGELKFVDYETAILALNILVNRPEEAFQMVNDPHYFECSCNPTPFGTGTICQFCQLSGEYATEDPWN